MEANKISLTALWCAYCRAHHVIHDNPIVFDDYLAHQMLRDEDRAEREKSIDQLMMVLQMLDPSRVASFPDRETAKDWIMKGLYPSSLLLSRARYTEDRLLKAIEQEGVTQYVILGAGLDTFAYRFPDLMKRLHVFEIDYPSMQTAKLSRLAELGWNIPAQLHHVPVDFTRDNLAEALKSSSFDPRAITLFSLLGVTYYLRSEEVFALLRAVREIAPAGSMVIFDYLDSEIFLPQMVARRVRVLIIGAQRAGEPFKSCFDPDELAATMTPLHLRICEDLGPSELQQLYFQGRTDAHYACEHAHIACAIVE